MATSRLRDRTLSSSSSIFGGPSLDPIPPNNQKAVLVANRGEIAVRIIRSIHELGLKAVAIYSSQDILSVHRIKANESYQLPNDLSPIQAYLSIKDIVEIAKTHNIGAIHPGYGFLSENAQFAQAVEDAGIAFVGPTPSVIEACGDKTKARSLAISAGVPVIPGSDGPIHSLDQAKAFVSAHGLPVIIKAAMGGGGRGMRVVRDLESLESLLDRAQSEAKSAFGDGTVFLERFLERPRHIEVQILADAYGNVIHLFERDCSVQRRHQKVVEMAPSINLLASVRSKIHADAIKLAKAVNYRNAGTAEFLVDDQNNHYFIEINPRIQVEHTVTEEITGIDIVSAQIQIALGASLDQLDLTQDTIHPIGVAIQCRVTTEDPARNFQPDTGRIEVYRSPGGPGVRIDGGPGFSGAIISPHYDSLLAKCICSGRDFESARRKMLRSLTEFRIRGLKTNIPFLIRLLMHPTFVQCQGSVWTTFIDDTPEILESGSASSRGQKLLQFFADLVVNGPRIKGQQGIPKFTGPIVLPSIPGVSDKDLQTPCQDGWRNILMSKGPEAFAQAVRSYPKPLIMDTTWRDAHQSILATRVRTIDMARIAIPTSYALSPCFALECWGGATFDVSMRFLYECPWQRLRLLRSLVPNIPFQMLLRGSNGVGYTNYPDSVIIAFVKHARECGVDVFRVFDSLNDVENIKVGMDAVIKANGVVEAAISYTGDVSDTHRTKYNLEYYLGLVDKLVSFGTHILGIKDMAGLLKPHAATILIDAIRAKYPDLPIHVHTHDTAGTGVASMIAAIHAGADIVDAAIDTMSGTTSQPSIGSITAALSHTAYATDLRLDHIQSLNTYWTQMRSLYSCFDMGIRCSDSGVYETEMPGGQYTNLMFQSTQLGLASQWTEVQRAYTIANKILGDIPKVTPSSKVVGDLAQLIVSQGLIQQDVYDRAETISFPKSVLEYLQGWLGTPPYGFPEPLRTRILSSRQLDRVTGRPGASLPPINFDDVRRELNDMYGEHTITESDTISYVVYPDVYKQYRETRDRYGDVWMIPTQHVLIPMTVGEEIGFEYDRGKWVVVKLVAVGPMSSGSDGQVTDVPGQRDVYFVLNGENRVVSVVDESSLNVTVSGGGGSQLSAKKSRRKCDAKDPSQIGAPMTGNIVDVRVKVGDAVKLGTPIAVMSAMKMETVVTCMMSGVVGDLCVSVGDTVSAGDLVAVITKPE